MIFLYLKYKITFSYLLPLFFYNALLNTTPLIWCKYDLSGLGYGKIEIYFVVAEILFFMNEFTLEI
jgi:hypothetical protein